MLFYAPLPASKTPCATSFLPTDVLDKCVDNARLQSWMSSRSVPQEAEEAQEVLTFARLCPLADGDEDDDGRCIEYEVLRDADDDDEDEPDEVGLVVQQQQLWCRRWWVCPGLCAASLDADPVLRYNKPYMVHLVHLTSDVDERSQCVSAEQPNTWLVLLYRCLGAYAGDPTVIDPGGASERRREQ